MKTEIIFRKFKDGEIIAFFPYQYHNIMKGEILSYMHIGQHGGASPELIKELEECTPEEYESLLNELKMIGYKNIYVINGVFENCKIK